MNVSSAWLAFKPATSERQWSATAANALLTNIDTSNGARAPDACSREQSEESTGREECFVWPVPLEVADTRMVQTALLHCAMLPQYMQVCLTYVLDLAELGCRPLSQPKLAGRRDAFCMPENR